MTPEKMTTGSSAGFPLGPLSSIPIGPVSSTSGSSSGQSPYLSSRVTSKARQILLQVVARQVKEAATEILDVIEQGVRAYRPSGDLDQVPEVRAYLLDGGSLLLEWAASEFRLGFNLEEKPAVSGWYFVTSPSLGQVGSDGLLKGADVQALVFQALRLLFATS